MANLENLRKQAKQLVRWHRDRVWTVAETIRTTLPRFAGRSDRQILDGPFKLTDAQELIARREGYESWQALVSSGSNDDGTGGPGLEVEPTPRVLVARPFVFVRDIEAACAYYADRLGFRVDFTYGQPPFYAEVSRDGIALCVRCTDTPMIDLERARREEIVPVSIQVEGVKQLYLEYQRAEVEFSQPYRVEPYGPRGFIVDDPDGNRLLFFEARADEV